MRKRLKKHLRPWIFSWITWVFVCAAITVGALIFALVQTPLNEDALKTVLKQEMFSELEIKNLKLSKKAFRWGNLLGILRSKLKSKKFGAFPIWKSCLIRI